MKKIYLILILSVATILTSCNKWLDIQPITEMRHETILSSEEGFQSILIGAYIRMATPALYGANTTVTLPELLAQHWAPKTNTVSKYLSDYDFTQTDSKTMLEDVWLQYYQTITNLNSLLDEIDIKKDLFNNGNYDLIKGEALGLRAFLHFEVLRYFGCTPSVMVAGDKAIPYVTVVSKNPNDLLSLSYEEVIKHINIDLNAAEVLLKNDPIIEFSNEILNAPGTIAGIDQTKPYPANDFHFFRQSRFNYFAVKATQARIALWRGDKKTALENALAIIDALNNDANLTPKFTLGDLSAASNGQLTFPTEHIFALNSTNSTQTMTPLLFNYQTAYTQVETALNNAFETTIHTNDIRYSNKRLWESKTIPLVPMPFNYFKKYNATGANTAIQDIPVIRLSEMYFIAIECGRTDLFTKYRVARSLDSSIDGTLTTDSEIKTRLEKEYRKEFYGEGQMFFFYKRLGYQTLPWPAAKVVTNANYQLPIPQTQSMFE